jgi:hypothetical protein
LLTNATTASRARVLAVAFRRWPVEHAFRLGKQEAGLIDYEGRNYTGLMRHLTLAVIVLGFVATHTQRLRGEKPTGDGAAIMEAEPGAPRQAGVSLQLRSGSPVGSARMGRIDSKSTCSITIPVRGDWNVRITDDTVRNYLACKYGAFRTVLGEHPASSEYELVRMRLRAQAATMAQVAILNHFGMPSVPPCEHGNAQVLGHGLPLVIGTILETPGSLFALMHSKEKKANRRSDCFIMSRS